MAIYTTYTGVYLYTKHPLTFQEQEEKFILESVDLNSISVPPLKSIPKLSPLNINKTNEITTKLTERILNLL